MDRTVQQLADEGFNLLKGEKYAEAFRVLREANDLAPGDPAIAIDLVRAGVNLGRIGELESILRTAVEANPGSAELRSVWQHVFPGPMVPGNPELEEVARHRIRGEMEAALDKFNNLLTGKSSLPGPYLREGIKLLVILEKWDHAQKFYNMLTLLPDAGNYLETEFLIRLQQHAPEGTITALRTPGLKPVYSWSQTFLTTGQDALLPLQLEGIRPECNVGSLSYYCTGTCGVCGTRITASLVRTFLVERHLYCPQCLAGLVIRYREIADLVDRTYPDMTAESVYAWDAKFYKLQEIIGNPETPGNAVPEMIRTFDQDYMFYLMQILWNHRPAGPA
jgi:hypothetical protein